VHYCKLAESEYFLSAFLDHLLCVSDGFGASSHFRKICVAAKILENLTLDVWHALISELI